MAPTSSWGMTETAAQVAAHRPRDGCWRPGLAGRPSPQWWCDDADGRLRPAGPRSCSATQSVPAPRARPLSTAGSRMTTISDGWKTARSRFWGRADDVLVSGGTNVHPVEIESRLRHAPESAKSAVAGIPDPVRGIWWWRSWQAPAEPPRRRLGAERTCARRPVPPHRSGGRLPRLAGGKIDRQALGTLLWNTPDDRRCLQGARAIRPIAPPGRPGRSGSGILPGEHDPSPGGTGRTTGSARFPGVPGGIWPIRSKGVGHLVWGGAGDTSGWPLAAGCTSQCRRRAVCRFPRRFAQDCFFGFSGLESHDAPSAPRSSGAALLDCCGMKLHADGDGAWSPACRNLCRRRRNS